MIIVYILYAVCIHIWSYPCRYYYYYAVGYFPLSHAVVLDHGWDGSLDGRVWFKNEMYMDLFYYLHFSCCFAIFNLFSFLGNRKSPIILGFCQEQRLGSSQWGVGCRWWRWRWIREDLFVRVYVRRESLHAVNNIMELN